MTANPALARDLPSATAAKLPPGGRSAARLRGVLRWSLGALVAAAFVFPLLWMVSGSLKGDAEVFANPPQLIPHTVVTSNYSRAVTYIDFWGYLRNSVIVTVFSVLGTLCSCVPAAYALSILRWRARSTVFGIVLVSIMLPFPAVMIPWYIIFRKVGMLGSLLPLVVPPFVGEFLTPAFSSALAIFLLRQFLRGIPAELVEAARLDGAANLRILLQVVLPLARPVLATVVIMTVLSSWTAFIGPLLFLNNGANFTLSVGLQQFQSQHFTAYNLLLAASLMFILPVLVVFLLGQRYFVRGVTVSGLK